MYTALAVAHLNQLVLWFCLHCMMASCSRPPKKVEQEITNGPNWLELPRDVTTNILQRLGVDEIMMSASQVCSLWWNVCKDPLMWRIIDMTNLSAYYPNSKLEKICRCAVERSCGHLEDISIECFATSIECFATDDLLKYIADSASHLRRMWLPRCQFLSDGGMREVVKKLSLLEHLNISYGNLSKDSLEAIGRSCPLLKGLKFCNSPSTLEYGFYDEDAFAIAKTMPELRYLNISGNRVTNKGLLAILDGCPMLEDLTLERCYQLDLSGSLGKRCHEQIKVLRLPRYFPYSEDEDIDGDDCRFISGTDYDNFGFEDYYGLSD